MRSYKVTLGLAAMSLLGGALSACSSTPTLPDMATVTDLRRQTDFATATPKGVYTMSNDVADNQIFVYARAADGTLTALSSFSTAGKGTGASLGSQNSLIFDSTINMFFAVNAGDNSISMLSLKSDGTLTLLYKILSGGVKPVSITETGGIVYVVNAGDNFMPANIAGFQVAGSTLTAIPSSIKPLSSSNPGAGPAQIQFVPGGATLVATEKTTNKIDTFTVAAGVASNPLAQNSLGVTPYGFAFSATGKLIVTEAAAGAATKGTASSYVISAAGTLTTVSNQVASNQGAPCWVVVSGANAFVSNTQSNNITAYSIGPDGMLSLLANGQSGMAGMGPTDLAITEANDYLYVLNGGSDSLSIFAVSAAGTLTKKPQDFPGLPANAVGLVAR